MSFSKIPAAANRWSKFDLGMEMNALNERDLFIEEEGQALEPTESPEELLYHHISQYTLFSWWSWLYLVDWMTCIGLTLVAYVVDATVYPHEREIDHDDHTIQHAHHPSTVSGAANNVFAMLLPACAFLAYNLGVFSRVWGGLHGWKGYRVQRNQLMGFLSHDLHHALLGLMASVSITRLITTVVKLLVGRLRPDFMARCAWSILEQKCAGDPDSIRDGRKSFPSGHSSIAFAGYAYLALYLASKLLRTSSSPPRLPKLLLVLSPLAIATWIALTRVADYRHHWQDVVAGSALGSIVSYVSFRLYFYAILPFHYQMIWRDQRIRLAHHGVHSPLVKAVPSRQGGLDHVEFLKRIGRGCEDAAEKFKDWNHLFTADSLEMKKDLGLDTKQRKWILAWTEQYRMGRMPYTIPSKPPKKK